MQQVGSFLFVEIQPLDAGYLGIAVDLAGQHHSKYEVGLAGAFHPQSRRHTNARERWPLASRV